jgi:hypothetical protein
MNHGPSTVFVAGVFTVVLIYAMLAFYFTTKRKK